MKASIDRHLIDGLGLWSERLRDNVEPGRPALILDRDGVLVEETHYLGRAEDVRMIPGVASAIKWANDAGLPVVIVTNQAGIGRGYYDWSGFMAVQDAIAANLTLHGAHLDLVLACAFHEDGKGPFASANHAWRKPNPGMILEAAALLQLDLPASLIIGDKISDIEAGQKAGVGAGTLVDSGHGRSESLHLDAGTFTPMRIAQAANIFAAVEQARAAGWPQLGSGRTLR